MVKRIKNIHDSRKKHKSKNDPDNHHHHHQPTKSGEAIGYNEHLLTEILSRLPVVSLLRFKSVSKHWHSLLSHLYNKLRLISPVPAGLFYDDFYIPFDVNNQNDNNNFNRPPFRIPHRIRDFKIVQSCNGLLLCCTEKGSDHRYLNLKYSVFNPTTNQFALIPSVNKRVDVFHNDEPFMGLAVHPADCKHYKLVCIYQNYDRSQLHVQIYSSETKRWKMSDETLATPCNYIFYLRRGVYMNNGGIYWSPEINSIDSWYYFKLDVEKFQKLEIPSSYRSKSCGQVSSAYYFGESNGRLHLVDVHWGKFSNLTVYEMMSDRSGWVVKCQVELLQFGYDLYIIDIVRGEQEEDTFMVVKCHGVIKSFNLFHKSFKNLSVIPGYGRSIKGHRYVPTSCLI